MWPAWIAIAQALGIVAANRLVPGIVGLRAAMLALGVLGPLLLPGARGRAALALVLAALAGAASLSARRDAGGAPSPVHRRDVIVEGAPCARPPHGAGLVLCDPVIVGAAPGSHLAGAPAAAAPPVTPALPARLLVDARPHGAEAAALARLAGAERLRARVRIVPIRDARNPGGRDARGGLARRGIRARGYLADPALAVAIGGAPPRIDRIRAGAEQRLEAGRDRIARRLVAAGPGGALLAALAVGDRSALPPEARADFAGLGIAHLLAVSGLHVVLVAGLAYAVLRRLLAGPLTRAGVGDPRGAAAAASLAAAVLYAALAGLGVPLQRALVMAAALAVAFVSGRRWPAAHVLGVAACVLLAVDPACLFEPGAQLSFAAVAALMAAPASSRPPPGPGRLGRATGSLLASVRTSALALAATAPVLAAHGMTLGVWGLLVNAFAVPATALVLPLALLAGALAALPAGIVPEGVLAGLAWPAGGLLAGATALADRLPPAPLAPEAGWRVLIVAVPLAVATVRAHRERVRAVGVWALVAWLQAAPVHDDAPAPPRLVALDVGQGDAVLVEGLRAAVLVDAGRRIPGRSDLGASVVVPALAALGVASLDVVVATHADVDHRGGLESVLRRVPVGALWLPAGGRADPAFGTLMAVAARRGVPVEEIDASGGARRVGDLRFVTLWPAGDLAALPDNDRSVVLRVDVGGDAVLLTGDVGRRVERRLLARPEALGARVLKVAHHGSDTSSHAAFLAAVGAGVAVVPAACGAASGLPRPEVLERLADHGAQVYWTGRDGAVVIGLGRARPGPPPVRTWGTLRACGRPASGPP